MSDLPPAIPTEFQIYDSYTVDPEWQRYYTYAWVAFTGVCILYSLPYLLKLVRTGRWRLGWQIEENLWESPADEEQRTLLKGDAGGQRQPNPAVSIKPRRYAPAARVSTYISSTIQSVTIPSIPVPTLTIFPYPATWPKPPTSLIQHIKNVVRRTATTQLADCCRRSYLSLSVGQLIIVAGYIALVIVCMLKNAELSHNSNRPGFLALAQLTPVFLLATKNNPIGLLLGLGYERLNWAHRWSGRLIWLSVTAHGAMWLNQFQRTKQYDQMKSAKSLRGIAAYTMLTFLAITSIKPVRRRWYQVFKALHIMSFVGFFVAVCYHTTYSIPWIFPPIALYALDLGLRMCKYRLKDAFLIPLDETMTMIHIPDCDAGWIGTQHVRIRVLAGLNVFESHPLTITNTPAWVGSGNPRGITLYAKVSGDWSRRINKLALKKGYESISPSSSDLEDDSESTEKVQDDKLQEQLALGDSPLSLGVGIKVLIDGPYGGISMDTADYQTILIIAGGSGITFAIGAMEEAIKRRNECEGDNRKALKLECVWVVRDMATIESLAPRLANLYDQSMLLPSCELSYRLFLTNPPFPLPSGPPSALLPSAHLSPYRPSISQIVRESLPPPSMLEIEENAGEPKTCCTHGGMAVIACGPEGIVAESGNAVAGLSVKERVRCGGMTFHGEKYSI